MLSNRRIHKKPNRDIPIIKIGAAVCTLLLAIVMLVFPGTGKVLAEGNLHWTAEEYQSYISETSRSQVEVSAGKIVSINVTNAIDLIVLSNLSDASIYDHAAIRLAMVGGGDIDLTQTVDIEEVTYSYAGLGTDAAPFAGQLVYNGGSEASGIILNTYLFKNLQDDSRWNSASELILKAGADMSGDVLFADKYVHKDQSEGTVWKLELQRRVNGSDDDISGGLIGTMCEGSILSLNMVSRVSTDIVSSGHAGFFCNEMQSGASLTIIGYSNGEIDNAVVLNNNITAGTGCSAGALVGMMEENASFTISADITVKGTIAAGSGNAGGIVGSAQDAMLSIGGESAVRIQGTVQGGLTAGGIFGEYIYSGAEGCVNSIDVSKFIVEQVGLSGGGKAGGLIGALCNNTDAGAFSVVGGGNTLSSELDGTVSTYGGIVGSYRAKTLADTLTVGGEAENMMTVTAGAGSVAAASYGAVIGEIADTASYVVVKNCASDTQGGGSQATYTGGIVGYINAGSMLDVSENITIDKSYNAIVAAGGIVGAIENGVVRLTGVTNLSSAPAGAETAGYGQIVGYRNNALIYAVGSGNDSNWKLIRNTSKQVSDIGNYGEVLRIDGTKLAEEKTAAGAGTEGALLTFDTVNHTVTVKAVTGSDVSVNNETDFAALALAIMLNSNQTGYGSLQFGTGVVEGESLLAANISLSENINLTGTGVTGLLRDDGTSAGVTASAGFSGTIDGDNHSITLAVGEAYGVTAGSENVTDASYGSGRIYNHMYTGLLARMTDAEVKNLTIAGNIRAGALVTEGHNIGALAAYANGTNAVTGSVSNVDIEYNGLVAVQAAGFIGLAEKGSDISFAESSFEGNIRDNSSANNCYDGGFIALLQGGTANVVNISDCKVKGSVTKSVKKTEAGVGGLIACISPSSADKSVNTVVIDGLIVDGEKVQTTASSGSGGLLGYRWSDLDLVMDGVTVSNSSLSTDTRFGGLVYTASGYWRVNKDGICFAADNSFTGKSSKGAVSGLIVAEARGYDNTNSNAYAALYLELAEGAYVINNGAVALSSFTVFDEIAGQSIGTNGNGVISIATEGAAKIDTAGCNTYRNQIAGQTYTNSDTRYYYNLDSIRQADGESKQGSLSLSTIDSGEKLLLWSVYQYAQSNIKKYFAASADGSAVITGDINLSGLSYYPISHYGSNIVFNDAAVTFDNGAIQTAETAAGNKETTNSAKQHYKMQFGLFENFAATTQKAASITVSGEQGLTLSGNVGYNETFSGVLVGGNAEGSRAADGLTNNALNISVSTGSKLCLDGIRLNGYDAAVGHNDSTYAPLLINTVGNYTSLSLSDVSTTEQYNSGATTPVCASSLIGRVGNAANGTYISLTFAQMGLDARTAAGSKSAMYGTYNSVFSHATFVESFEYADASTCFGQYTFNAEDELITYGKEISNTEGGAVSGRNNGKQYQYFDHTAFVRDVENGMGAVDAGNASEAFASGYLRYVCKPENVGSSSYELDINQMAYELTEGCGTYGDPYIIDNGSQLESIAAYLAGSPLPGWSIRVDLAVLNAQNGASAVHTSAGGYDKHARYNMSGSGKWTAEGSDGYTNTKVALDAALTTYLRNAYYLIEKDIDLGKNGTFTGLGSSNVMASGTGSEGQSRSFSGVLVGKADSEGRYPKIRVYAPNTSVNQYGGLVKFANGCVVKDLQIEYVDQITIESSVVPADKTPANQVFFGGVIGYALGGDDIIDNVKVTSAAGLAGCVAVSGAGDYMANVGGYVGLVGGNVTEGGGVIFKNMSDDYKLTTVIDKEANSIDLLDAIAIDTKQDGSQIVSDSGNTHLYWNPYVGRVLDGFVCYDGANSKNNKSTKLTNTDKNYTIPTLAEDSKISDEDTVIKIGSSQQLWVLSAIVNSGAGSMKVDGSYDEGSYAYHWGKVRNGNYDHVGENFVASDSLIAIDENYWGGTSASGPDKTCYLLQKFAEGSAEERTDSKIIDLTTAGTELANWKNTVSDIYVGADRLYSTGSNKTAYGSAEIKSNNGIDTLQVVKDANNYLDKYEVKYYVGRYNSITSSVILASGELSYEPLTIDYSSLFRRYFDGTDSLRLFIAITAKDGSNMNSGTARETMVLRNNVFVKCTSTTGVLSLEKRENEVAFAGTNGSYTAYRPFPLKEYNNSDVLTIKESKDDVFFMIADNITYSSGKRYTYNGEYITPLVNGQAEFDIGRFMSENGLASKDKLYLHVFVRNRVYAMNYLEQSLNEINLEMYKNGVKYYAFRDLGDIGSPLYSSAAYTVANGAITDVKAVTSAGNDKRYSYVIPLDDGIRSINVENNTTDQKGQIFYYVTDGYPAVGTRVFSSATTEKIYKYTFDETFIRNNSGRYLIVMIGNNSSSFGDMGTSFKGLKITIDYSDISENDYPISKALNTFNSLHLTADCDMTAFGNGFRGIGTSFQDNVSKDVLKRSLPLVAIDGNSHYIKLARNVYEYSDDAACWWTQGVGLFPVIYFPNSALINDLTIKGTVEVKYRDNTTDTLTGYIGEASAGGFSGMTANGSGIGSINLKNVQLKDLAVTGAKYNGGFIGVVGISSRTTAKELKKISTDAGTYTFTNCGYDSITVEGFYTAGGFIGTWNNNGSRYVYINGMTSLSNSNIGWLKDACLEMYKVRPSGSGDAKTNGYSGAGGIVGFSNKDMFINQSSATAKLAPDSNKLSIDGLHVYGPQEAFNCDYGLGTIAGLVNGGTNICVYNAEVRNSKIEVILDEDYESQFKKYPGENPYYTPSIGTLFGYAKTIILMDEVTLENDFVLNGGYAGGVIGNVNKKATITNLHMDKIVVYSKGAYTYNGSDLCGGIVGSHSASADFLLDTAEISNLIVGNDGRAAGILANSKNTTNNIFKNIYFSDCIISTVGEPTGDYYETTQSDPGAAATRTKKKLNYASETGLLVASSTDYNSEISNQNNIAFNMLTENPLVGYCVEGNKYGYDYDKKVPTYNGNPLKTFEDYKKCYSADTVGVYTGVGTGIPYSTYVFTESKKDEFTKGFFGSLVGKVWSSTAVRVVGWTNIGGYLPYEISGDNNVGFNDKDSNYVILADYAGTSSVNNPELNTATGTIDGNSFVHTDAAAPYVVINPLSEVTVYDGSAALQFTGDGFGKIAQQILLDTADPYGESHSLSKPVSQLYYKSGTPNSALKDIAAKYLPGGDKEAYIVPFSEAREVDGSLSGIEDFDVLVLQTINSREITETVNEYVSVLTGCNQTGTGASAPRYAEIVPYTFAKNPDSGKYERKSTATLAAKGTGASTVLSVVSGKYDNTMDQFTVLDVIYQNPFGTEEYYHLYVPVVIKRILNFDFYASILSGTAYNSDAYANLSTQVIANYGDSLTAYLEFEYYRSAEEWQASIDAGESLLWNYDKLINLGRIKLPEGTRLTLTDKNKGGLAYAVSVDSAMLTETVEGSYVLDFGKVFGKPSASVGGNEGWKCAYFSELLNLKVDIVDTNTVSDENTAGRAGLLSFVALDSSGGVPADATVYWDGVYYRPATDEEKTAVSESDETAYANTLYTIRTQLKNNAVDEGFEVVKLIESYYLTIQIPADNASNAVVNNAITYEPQTLLFDKETVSGIPTKKKNRIDGSTTIYAHRNNENKYIICDFFNTEFDVETSNGDELMSEANRDIYVEIKNRLNFTSATAMNYSDNIELWQGFVLKYAEFDEHSNSFFTTINAGTVITYDFTVTDLAGNVITYGGTELENVYGGTITLAADTKEVDIAYPANLLGVLRGASASNEDGSVDGGIIVRVDAAIKYETDSLEEQFPVRMSTLDRSGISVAAQSKVAFNREALGHPSIKINQTDEQNRFYVEESSLANLKYYAYKINTGDNTGNESQMGINPNEPMNNADVIYTEGVYDTNLVLEKGDYVRCVIQLQHKTDNPDGGAVYGNSLVLGKYLENITVNGFNASDDAQGVRYAVAADGKSLTVVMPCELIKEKDKVFFIPIDFSAFTGNENEAADASAFESEKQIYANYKVTLSVAMLKENMLNATAIDGSTCSDYIIYTNARVRTDIIDMSLYE